MPQSWTDTSFNEFRGEMARRFDDLGRRMDERFEHVDRRFDEVDRRFDEVDRRLEQFDRRFELVDTDMRNQRGELGSMQRTMVLGVIAMSSAYVAGFSALIAFLATQV